MDLTMEDCYGINEIYRTIVDASYDSIMVTDADARIVVVNNATAECMGLPKEQLIGKRPSDLMSMGLYKNSTVMAAMRTRSTITGIVTVKGRNRFSTSRPLFDENGNLKLVVTNNRSDAIMDEFLRQLNYEKQQHAQYRNIADYLYSYKGGEIICSSPQMRSIVSECTTICQADSPAMLVGESGVGKELIAKLIHSSSSRKEGPFIPVNCSAIPPELFESEFFGYRPGAFTGASSKGKTGLLQMAHKGTLFLDELGELPLLMQSKLLRFAESGEFYPVGSSHSEKVDVRIISATNRNLPQMIREKHFRKDLYYRLHVIPIHIPPLRERPEDIEAIALHFQKIYNKKYGRKTIITGKGMKLLKQYRWPGNVRELRNIIERAVLMSTPERPELPLTSLHSMLMQEWNAQDESGENTVLPFCQTGLDLPLDQAVERFQQQYIKAVVDQYDGKLQDAAKALGVHRSTLYRKMKENL